MIILSVETSCDETASALVEDGIREIASVVASSKEFHEKTGGIVPEVAARKQVEFVVPVIDGVLNKFIEKKGFSSKKDADKHIDGIAVTVGPGLIGSLIVGVEAAKALSLAWNKPVVPVNHLVGHIYANFVDNPKSIEFPAVVLVVSGGHTDLILMKGHGSFEYLGGTLDDAAGEAFDKTARLLGLSKYLGGAQLSQKASECKNNFIEGKLPRPMIREENFDFSFSGLKTAVRRLVEKEALPVEVVAREFENAVVDVLVAKTIRAAKKFKVRSILLGGGVSANQLLRNRIEVEGTDFSVYIPKPQLCTDNGVYIASAAYFNFRPVKLEKLNANPSLTIMDRV